MKIKEILMALVILTGITVFVFGVSTKNEVGRYLFLLLKFSLLICCIKYFMSPLSYGKTYGDKGILSGDKYSTHYNLKLLIVLGAFWGIAWFLYYGFINIFSWIPGKGIFWRVYLDEDGNNFIYLRKYLSVILSLILSALLIGKVIPGYLKHEKRKDRVERYVRSRIEECNDEED